MRPGSWFHRMRGVIALALLVCFIAAFVLTACSDDDTEAEPPATPTTEVTVLAAASVEPALRRVDQDLRSRGASVTLRSEYGGTSTLVSQIRSGRAFDIVITASRTHMADLVDDGAVAGDAYPLATNRLALVVPADNPGEIDSFDDFIAHAAELTTATCAEDVPCGELARTMQEELGVDVHADTEETSVASVMTKVRMGEVDAGFAYLTDAEAADDEVEVFEIPDFPHNDTQIWAAVAAEPQEQEAAEQLFTLLVGESGRTAFEEAGFLPPPAAEASSLD
ncbi:molybdate ABC transporter substrate-binding protein [Nesterenkonia sp. CL21]|uniref:molybdate ABC transporter substrate-binding protein n=1 Tax=unclassified Nesterenkonia TaxID=2629769 RepID=UPI0028784C09|nr:molybdate ABC transporter substrate-binding protein [Nesterenkonia sp. CL21]MDS2173988.1 molybdate ABC transporter substrate-binding protein [Nesterenkonia sp. CL21]